MALGIDANNAWDYPTALKMARACEKENVLFFEEPMSTDYPEACLRLAQHTDVSIAGYETLLPRYGMKDFITRSAVDIVQTEACLLYTSRLDGRAHAILHKQVRYTAQAVDAAGDFTVVILSGTAHRCV